MSFSTVKRICSRVYGVGETRVKILDVPKVQGALTADDVRSLVKEKAIIITPLRSPSRRASRWKQSRIAIGRRRGKGSRKGTKVSEKSKWLKKIRSQRKLLFSLKSKFKQKSDFRKVYLMIKGSAFRNKRAVLSYLRENKMVV